MHVELLQCTLFSLFIVTRKTKMQGEKKYPNIFLVCTWNRFHLGTSKISSNFQEILDYLIICVRMVHVLDYFGWIALFWISHN